MLARTPLTEVEIEGVGTYRLPNQWQAHRLRRLRGEKRHTAVLALGAGMTVRQFMKLPDRLQAEVHKAYLALMSSANVAPLADSAPADTRVIPRGHLSIDQKLAIGRWLIQTKASLPRGHFGPWLDKQRKLSRSMAQQCMALVTGGRQDARGACFAVGQRPTETRAGDNQAP
ncbi:DUF3102 domain-containing protein [Mesorhizobium onobrychidis]|uniref:DUF3102 domain-containing protein n=1 Tax=Mesorhizobium onobrychidis TaxID=2775404 RepID=A0ABY5R2V4_9HYPH|nr:DUF3102 domain-containing protein [Mesorhizobium onobrychidis]UVC17638.1 hypothetical protein IHQ72_11390 [Mesorhizobium onobrychidis]